MRLNRFKMWFVVLFLLLPAVANAHVGNKDVFVELHPGPYKLFVTIRPPLVIPGVATVEVRSSGPTVNSIRINPVPMTGEASKHPPTPDPMQQSKADPAFFTGSLWLMGAGSWKVQLSIEGTQGKANAGVPVPAMALSVMRMDRRLGLMLGALGAALVLGIVGIVAAASRESRLPPGEAPDAPRRKHAMAMGAVALVAVVAAVWLGGWWWNVEAATYASYVYQPLALTPSLQGDTLDLKIGSFTTDNVRRNRVATDLLPDHGHLMHLYAIREPEMDAVYHLHPSLVAPGELRMYLPAMPPGRYRLFGDIVHRSGLPETLTSTLEIPQGFTGGKLAPEDASAAPPEISAGEMGSVDKLPDGYSMVWDKPATLVANQPADFRFHLLNAQGKPAADAVTYLGMAGHAAFVKTDWTAFAHTHPEGSAPMQSMAVANDGAVLEPMSGMAMEGMDMAANVSPTVEFPYGFPAPGKYRIFVQMKHSSIVETGVFDAEVH
ncbi:hypothetical protein Terro_1121 [Terriglobus roseus DSM 18391]|uniref:Uncharacterized protein n=1 Tax=Terriglobus roseus (strain DSM 18391 / NRRL B-41598 / KBS 63) TaxID=926566 RepID=I3ZDX2_TERRK|nr:hypothetical protein [Terriglobus roseus]AFL87440.1 hypothetical protein Terro_1121 [Terriglobus roseus DSM 18391]